MLQGLICLVFWIMGSAIKLNLNFSCFRISLSPNVPIHLIYDFITSLFLNFERINCGVYNGKFSNSLWKVSEL